MPPLRGQPERQPRPLPVRGPVPRLLRHQGGQARQEAVSGTISSFSVLFLFRYFNYIKSHTNIYHY